MITNAHVPKREEEARLKKEKLEREKKEREEKERAEKSKQQKLNLVKEKAVEDINIALNQEPQITSNELGLEYQDWEIQINNLTEENQITSYKDKTLSHIQFRKKDKKTTEEVNENLQKATSPNATIQDKKEALENLDKNEGESAYEERKEETKQVKKEVAKDNPNEYRDKVVSDLDKKLIDNGLSEDDLDSQTQQEIKDLKNVHDLNADKLVETEIKITEKIGQAGAKKKIDNLVFEVEAVLKTKDKNKIEKVKEQLLEIINSNNVYYSVHKSQVKQLLEKLETSVIQPVPQTSNNKILSLPIKIMIGIGIVLVLAFFGYLMWTQQKNPKWTRGKKR